DSAWQRSAIRCSGEGYRSARFPPTIIGGGGTARPVVPGGAAYSSTQRLAAAASLASASTQRPPSGVSSSFQHGAERPAPLRLVGDALKLALGHRGIMFERHRRDRLPAGDVAHQPDEARD